MDGDIKLIPEGEIRFGPTYHRLAISGREVANAIFGEEYSLLDNGRFVAIQEWLTYGLYGRANYKSHSV